MAAKSSVMDVRGALTRCVTPAHDLSALASQLQLRVNERTQIVQGAVASSILRTFMPPERLLVEEWKFRLYVSRNAAEEPHPRVAFTSMLCLSNHPLRRLLVFLVATIFLRLHPFRDAMSALKRRAGGLARSLADRSHSCGARPGRRYHSLWSPLEVTGTTVLKKVTGPIYDPLAAPSCGYAPSTETLLVNPPSDARSIFASRFYAGP